MMAAGVTHQMGRWRVCRGDPQSLVWPLAWSWPHGSKGHQRGCPSSGTAAKRGRQARVFAPISPPTRACPPPSQTVTAEPDRPSSRPQVSPLRVLPLQNPPPSLHCLCPTASMLPPPEQIGPANTHNRHLGWRVSLVVQTPSTAPCLKLPVSLPFLKKSDRMFNTVCKAPTRCARSPSTCLSR